VHRKVKKTSHENEEKLMTMTTQVIEDILEQEEEFKK
jgi:hypothetical protein